jgi:hypothetical protein
MATELLMVKTTMNFAKYLVNAKGILALIRKQTMMKTDV